MRRTLLPPSRSRYRLSVRLSSVGLSIVTYR
jgi:hypothetical protein